MKLWRIQEDAREWMERNFPNTTADEQFLGVVEEVGELAHALLKMKQGIRDSEVEDAMDAVGDIAIFLMNFCSKKGWSLEDIIEQTWGEVSNRDWQTNPKDGKVE